jgi:hypothetical protein
MSRAESFEGSAAGAAGARAGSADAAIAAGGESAIAGTGCRLRKSANAMTKILDPENSGDDGIAA